VAAGPACYDATLDAMPIHPTAVVDPRAEIDPTANIGPYVVIEGPVRVGAGTRVLAHAYLCGDTAIGRDNEIHMGAVIGHAPQDLAYRGAPSGLLIGDRNIIREHAQVHRGTAEGSRTIVGDDNFLMNQSHVAHNCRLGNGVILAGGALLAGYVEVADRAFVSGNCVVHQFVRIGTLAIMRGLSRTSRDVPPFCVMDGTHTVRAVNLVGLRRAGFDRVRIRALREAFTRLFRRAGNLGEAVRALRQEPGTPDVTALLDFIEASRRGVCFGPRGGDSEEGEEG
jgi:UDP-N-acetylglucosamine acyltransferase